MKSTKDNTDRTIVIWNGNVMAPNTDYIFDPARDNQIRFLVGRVKPGDVIQILDFAYGGSFDRTIIRGKDYLEFHDAYVAVHP
jgi:hypothetical protein